jgi:hypothetical protein
VTAAYSARTSGQGRRRVGAKGAPDPVRAGEKGDSDVSVTCGQAGATVSDGASVSLGLICLEEM